MDLHDIYDTAPFFDGTFDLPVQYTPGSGPSREIQGIFDAEGAMVQIGDAVIINERPTLTLQTKEVRDLDNRARFEFHRPDTEQDVIYEVHDYAHDATGITIVQLKHG